MCSSDLRAPGDWDAWVSQGPVAVHAREHLGYTDQGVAMYRKLVKEGIAAVQAGKSPKGLLKKKPAKPILTYCHNTVKKVARPATEQEDRALAAEFGREIYRQIKSGKLAKKNVGAEYPRDFTFPAKR